MLTPLAEQIVNANPRAIARAATWIEQRRPEGQALLKELFPKTGRALILGITGPPGAGKSTLCDQLIRLLRAEGKTVGVIAVDPSSPFTGGAILGDRVRMQRHHGDPGVFIRSLATRGWTGGLARAAAEIVLLLDAAGRDVILVETIGAGQDEIDIARLAAVTLVVLTPGMGDDVQAMKAGMMEIADVFVLNKSDHPAAARFEQELHMSLGDTPPPIVKTVASEGQGIAEVLAAVRECAARLDPQKTARLWSLRLRDMLREAIADRLPDLDELGAAVANRASDPFTIVEQLSAFGIDHLGIAVPSIDEALKFYRDLLGLSAGPREVVAAEQVDTQMIPLAGSRIELLEAVTPDSVIAKFIEKRGPGLHHVAIRVPDLNAALDRLRSAGARLLNEPRLGAGGHTYVFVHPSTTGGVLIELIQA